MAKSVTNNLVPVIGKNEFDNEATAFLTRYCPEALDTPMPVPIRTISEKKMGLTILENRLTEDFSIFGQMCFTSGIAEIYDRDEEEYREITVKRGTMIIDPDTLLERNLGCMNNTITHESFHWFKHRNYHILQGVIDGKRSIAFHCPSNPKSEKLEKVWTDEDWMEWQANGIAPRILMPRQTVSAVFNQFASECANDPLVRAKLIPTARWIIEHVADFYIVSKQSAEIRLRELGHLPL